jgi:hypothetical protein
MDGQVKKTKMNGLPSTLPHKRRKEDNFITIEVVSLRDVPLCERHKQANKPLYLKRYE